MRCTCAQGRRRMGMPLSVKERAISSRFRPNATRIVVSGPGLDIVNLARTMVLSAGSPRLFAGQSACPGADSIWKYMAVFFEEMTFSNSPIHFVRNCATASSEAKNFLIKVPACASVNVR